MFDQAPFIQESIDALTQEGILGLVFAVLVVTGGLVSSTLLTLVVLPVLYFIVKGGRERRAERREARTAGRDESPVSSIGG